MKRLIKSKTYHAKYRTYFLKLYQQSNDVKLLEITESKVIGPNKYKRTQIKIFEEDIEGFLKVFEHLLRNDKDEEKKFDIYENNT